MPLAPRPSAEPASVAVLMGGISPEHPVSLASGCGILAQLDPARYRGFPVLISKRNEWIWPEDSGSFSGGITPAQAAAWIESPPKGWIRIVFPRFEKFPTADIFFLGLHGAGGEDGRLQGFLELAGQPYTGSGSLSSALAMDKILTKQAYVRQGIPTAPWMVLGSEDCGEAGADRVIAELGLPAVVKDPAGGSSLGVALARTRPELIEALGKIGANVTRVLVEAFVAGREATCGVLEGVDTPLPPTEIRPTQDAFFSFEAKYQEGRTQEITPAEFPPEAVRGMQRLAAEAHKILGLSVYSRTDFIWAPSTGSGTGQLFALETNNLPGFTPTSILPQQAAHIGMSYRDLVTHVIEESRRRWQV